MSSFIRFLQKQSLIADDRATLIMRCSDVDYIFNDNLFMEHEEVQGVEYSITYGRRTDMSTDEANDEFEGKDIVFITDRAPHQVEGSGYPRDPPEDLVMMHDAMYTFRCTNGRWVIVKSSIESLPWNTQNYNTLKVVKR